MTSSTGIERYALLDLMSESGDVRLWRAHDDTLGRDVTVRLLPLSDPRATSVRDAARRSALVDDRRLVRVLDVIDYDGSLGIVTEWVAGRSLADLLDERSGEPLPPAQAVSIAMEVARAVSAGARSGVPHGRLRPSSVLITDAGEVRVLGLGVDIALWGSAGSQSLAARADVHGLGCLLYAGLTGHWPDGIIDGLPAAPRHGRRILVPSAVVADIPTSLDEIVERSIDGMTQAKPAYDGADAVAVALGSAPLTTTARVTFSAPKPPGVLVRAAGVLAITALAAIIGFTGWTLLQGSQSPWSSPARPLNDQVLTSPVEGDSVSGGTDRGAGAGPLRTRAFKASAQGAAVSTAAGATGGSDADSARLVADGDLTSAWFTGQFETPELTPGSGVVIDLGASVSISSVRLELVGNGTDVAVKVADTRLPDADLWQTFTAVRGAGRSIDLRTPTPVTGRYVLVWFTKVPPFEGGGYAGGLRDITIGS